jgi:hypothetical protein
MATAAADQASRDAGHNARYGAVSVDGVWVSELAERAGVAPWTVRCYERAGRSCPGESAGDVLQRHSVFAIRLPRHLN